jgi:hypothetical protein
MWANDFATVGAEIPSFLRGARKSSKFGLFVAQPPPPAVEGRDVVGDLRITESKAR